jgi:hypothetical protein
LQIGDSHLPEAGGRLRPEVSMFIAKRWCPSLGGFPAGSSKNSYYMFVDMFLRIEDLRIPAFEQQFLLDVYCIFISNHWFLWISVDCFGMPLISIDFFWIPAIFVTSAAAAATFAAAVVNAAGTAAVSML